MEANGFSGSYSNHETRGKDTLEQLAPVRGQLATKFYKCLSVRRVI
jgi:hypothetical protein